MPSSEERLVVRMEATLAKFERQMKRGSKVASDSARTSQRAWRNAGRQIEAQAGRAATGLSRVMNISGRGRFVLTNTANQFGDIAVQLQGGTDAARVMGQQLPQLLGGFGALGGALGIVAPLLGTVAAVGIPVAAMFAANGRASDDLADKTRTLTEAVDGFVSAAERSNITSADMAEAYGTAASAAAGFINSLREIEQIDAFEALGRSIEDIAGDFKSFSDDAVITMAEAGRQIDNLQSDYDELERREALAVRDPNATDAEINAIRKEIDLFFVRQQALEKYQDALNGLQGELGLTAQQAGLVADALSGLAAADGARQQAEAANEVLRALEQAVGSYAQMNDAARAVYREVREIGEEAAKMQGAIENTTDAAFDLAAAIGNVGPRLSGAVGIANDLAASLSTAAANAWNMLSAVTQAANKRQLLESGAVGPDAALNQIRDTLTPEGLRRDAIVATRTFAARPTAAAGRSGGTGGGGGGSAGGGGGGPALEPLFANVESEITALERQIEMIGKTSREVATLKARYDLLDEARARGLDLTARQADTGETLIQQIDRQAEAIGNLTERSERYAERADFLADQQDALKEGFLDAVVAGEDFAGTLENIAIQLAKASLEAGLFGTGPLAGGQGTGLLSGLGSFLFGGLGLPSFDGGGRTPSGSRSGGIDGRGGFPAILHPDETVIDHTKPGSAGGGTVRVVIEEGPGFAARVRTEAEGVAVQTVRAYDAEMPRRVGQITQNPRRI